MRPEESFVGANVRSLQTMLRVISEHDTRLPIIIPDGIYGQDTINAVSAFQRTNSLPVTGITDQATWEAIASAYDLALIYRDKPEPIQVLFEPGQIIRLGEYNANIFLLQAMLAFLATQEKTISSPGISGTLDSATSEAISAFQLLAGLETTGELDRLTWKNIVHQYILGANRENRRKPPKQYYL
ncbi:MAG: peptidoglycan-binding protein [Oscillospiraceae bacterium]|nr:peptidoglycan-binding protein [Oscillospiraceae bacterium]